MTKQKYIYSFIIIIFVIALYSSCAQIGRPEGGPKDETPPIIELSSPENMTTNFSAKKIIIEFDENIQLKELNKQLIVSPPMEEKPEIKTNMNKLIIKFIDSLRSNTTYTLNFANSIADLNEANVFENYNYIFSTGSVIDSFQVNGQLLNAFDKEPILEATVLLHNNLSDTAFLSEIPSYIAKTDSSGKFSIKYIAPGNYKLYALKDAQFNFTYATTTEEAAFFPEIITPSIKEVTKIDTIKIIDTIKPIEIPDSLNLEINNSDSIKYDTIYRDSIVEVIVFDYFPKEISLSMFLEISNNQFIAEKKRDEKGKIEISFNLDSDSTFFIEALDLENAENWQILEKVDDKNYTLWISDSSIYNKEELNFIAHYQTLDSLENTIVANDTLSFKYFDKKENKEEENKELTININATKKTVEVFDPLKITFSVPLATFISDSIKLYELKDTSYTITENDREKTIKEKVEVAVQFKALQDSVLKRQYNLTFNRKAETDYKIVIDSASLSDIFGNTNSFFESEFQFQDSSFYSNIILNVSNIDTFSIVQLLSEDKKVLKEYFISTDSATLNFNFLAPEKYFLKIISDTNNNKKWDTGNFKEAILPEKVYFYKEIIETKANWSNEIDWNLLIDD